MVGHSVPFQPVILSDPDALSGGIGNEVLGGFTRTFTSSGTLTVSVPTLVEYLVVAGGGGGGNGGGGGGQVRRGILFLAAGTYAITVGAGGIGSHTVGVLPGNGGNSSIGDLIEALGGGGGGIYDTNGGDGRDGGNGGGGAAYPGSPLGISAAGQPLTPDGFPGGIGVLGSSGSGVAYGGGGGASEAGGNGIHTGGTSGQGGKGGDGVLSTITGSPVYYGGGGGGPGAHATNPSARGLGGLGGGGIGSRWHQTNGSVQQQSTAGAPNTGGGAGGNVGTGSVSQNGGSGIVIVKYGSYRGLVPWNRESPLDLDPLVFWDLNAPGSLWQDVEGSIPVLNVGDPVSLIRDRSGNGHHLILSGCTFEKDPQGRPRVYFNHAQSHAQTIGPVEFSSDEVQISAVIGKRALTYSGGTLIGFGRPSDEGSWQIFGADSSEDDLFLFSTRGTESVSASASGYTSPVTGVVTARSSIGSDVAEIRIDGSLEDSSSEDQGDGDYGSYPITVGSSAGGFNREHMYLGSVAIFDSLLDSTDTEKVEGYLSARSSNSDSSLPTLTSPPSVATPEGFEVGAALVSTFASWDGADSVQRWWVRDGVAIEPVTHFARLITENDYTYRIGILEVASNAHGSVSAVAYTDVVEPPSYLKIVGGEMTLLEEHVVHVFKETEMIRVLEEVEVDYLVVGGGAGTNHQATGGFPSRYANGGGGAGGVKEDSIVLTEDILITVGLGGLSQANSPTGLPENGQPSSIGDLVIALGGGHGGNRDIVTPAAEGASGGGGGGNYNDAIITFSGAQGTPGQGHDGGDGQSHTTANNRRSGGGGGAGGRGSHFNEGSHGGPGITSDITGEEKGYAGGGGGQNNGFGGTGTHGGGDGQPNTSGGGGENGEPNTGGGGGAPNGNGGSGVVVLRYPRSDLDD